jgi:hypothetical protein
VWNTTKSYIEGPSDNLLIDIIEPVGIKVIPLYPFSSLHSAAIITVLVSRDNKKPKLVNNVNLWLKAVSSSHVSGQNFAS